MHGELHYNVGEQIMAAIYNQQVSQLNRAKLLFLSAAQAHANIPEIAKSTDALILKMGGMDGAITNTSNGIYEESGFKIRVDQAAAAGLPVFGEFVLDARNYLDRQMNLSSVENMVADKNNPALTKIIDLLQTGSWDYSTLDATKNWRSVHSVILRMTNTSTAFGDISDIWQATVLQSVLYPLKALQNTGKFPNIPIIFHTYPSFLTKYKDALFNFLYNRRAEINVGLAQWVFYGEPWMQVSNLQTLWNTTLYRPNETFKYLYTPYGYAGENGDGHILFHWFSNNHFKTPEVTRSDGTMTPVDLGLWCDTKDALYKFLNFTQTPLPPPIPVQMVKLIYLSFAQNIDIDGPLLAKSVSAVMVRAGQGIWEDPRFRYNYKICIDNNIPFGIWWFCQPDMAAEPQIEAFMKVWNSLPIKPSVIAYDVEEIDYKDANGVWQKVFPPSKQFNHDNVLKWCQVVKDRTGAKVGIYTRKNYFEAWTNEDEAWYEFWMWIAAWYIYTGEVEPALPWHWPTFKIHQYEGGGLGTPGVDPATTCKERFNGTLEECLSFFGIEVSPTDPEKELLKIKLAAWKTWYDNAPQAALKTWFDSAPKD